MLATHRIASTDRGVRYEVLLRQRQWRPAKVALEDQLRIELVGDELSPVDGRQSRKNACLDDGKVCACKAVVLKNTGMIAAAQTAGWPSS